MMFQKFEHNVLLAGFAFSAILLFCFGFSENSSLRYLDIPQAWFFVSAVPIVLTLIVGGFIKKGNFAGIEFEVSSEEASELVIPATSYIVSNVPPMMKGSSDSLEELSLEQRRNIKILNFEQEWNDYYREETVFKYFDALVNLSYIRVLRQGRSSQYISIDALKSFCLPNVSRNLPDYDSEDQSEHKTAIQRFLKSLRNDLLHDDYRQSVSELIVNEDEKLDEILKKMYDHRVQFAAVVTSNQSFIGIIESTQIEKQICKSFLRMKKSK